jgi:hypothetical protein
MDVSISILDGVCHVVCVGDFNSSTHSDAMHKLMDHPGFLPSMDCLWDCCAVDATDMTADDTSRMASFVNSPSNRRGVGRTALVADQDDAFGMGQMYALRFEDTVPGAFRVFRTIEAALEWLADPARDCPAPS